MTRTPKPHLPTIIPTPTKSTPNKKSPPQILRLKPLQNESHKFHNQRQRLGKVFPRAFRRRHLSRWRIIGSAIFDFPRVITVCDYNIESLRSAVTATRPNNEPLLSVVVVAARICNMALSMCGRNATILYFFYVPVLFIRSVAYF